MLKMTAVRENEQTITLKLEGRIVGPWVEELEKECEKCLLKKNCLILDLSEVSYIDERGINTIRGFLGPRIQSVGGSLFLEGLMKEEKKKI